MPRLTTAALAGSFVVAFIVLGGARAARAQPGDLHQGGGITFRSGQNVQPIFDGWSKNPDGSFEMHFGYLNRNHVEELHVPVGTDNIVEPGGPDRGQPTYFYSRFNRRVFSVTVPKDFGKREVVWTLAMRGKTERAVGWLQAEWEIDPNPRGSDKSVKNTPPTIAVTNPGPVRLPARATLTAKVTDDGLPPPSKTRVGGNSENPPGFRFDGPSVTAPVNVPDIERPARPRMQGLTVTWLVLRGPAGVALDPAVTQVKDGQAVVAATFSKPGEYVLRARASDSSLTTIQDVKVVVTGGEPANRP
jgi:hypothetical protein